ncbi:MFS transporter [Leisingera sp. F5]|uniref:MFS transporter n=1 Tax=Leisingera sp. F5 TaxID=1813816 RepID=UPI000B333FFB|nr:MFS transporter [Leisingera sp. F5]
MQTSENETGSAAKFSPVFLSAFGFAQLCSWGTLYYAFPQMAVAMGTEFGWAKSEIYVALTIGLLMSALVSVPVGAAIDKGYGRAIMTGGSVFAGILFFAWSQTQSLLWFYVAFGGIGCLQAAVLYNASFAVVARHCDTSKTRDYVTTLTLWGGFASTVFIPSIEYLMGYFDWRQVLIALGLVNVLVCASIYYFLPRVTSAGSGNTSEPKASVTKEAPARALRRPVFWALLMCFVLYGAMETSFRFHLYPLLGENGLSSENAVFILALFGPAQVAGRAFMKVFQTRSIASIGIFVASIFPLALLAFALFPESFPVLVAAAIAYGAATGVMTIVMGLSVPELLSKTSYGAINGMLNTPALMSKAFAPAIAALVWSSSGSYAGLLFGLSAVSATMLLAFVAAVFLSNRNSVTNQATA